MTVVDRSTTAGRLVDRFERGLDAPICLTWELTYACNLACVHCLSSSGRRDPMELTPAEARRIVDELAAMKVFYVNIGGGEPMLRPDFFDLVGYAVDNRVGVKFSTNGTRLTAERARRLAAMDYVESLCIGAIGAHEQRLLELATAELSRLPDIELIGTAAHKASVLSFTMKGVHPHDLGTILDAEGVAVRTGHHCAMPVMTFFGIPATARASFGCYNTQADVASLVAALNKARAVFA